MAWHARLFLFVLVFVTNFYYIKAPCFFQPVYIWIRIMFQKAVFNSNINAISYRSNDIGVTCRQLEAARPEGTLLLRGLTWRAYNSSTCLTKSKPLFWLLVEMSTLQPASFPCTIQLHGSVERGRRLPSLKSPIHS